MFCPNCGNQIPDYSQYCPNCNKPIGNNYVSSQDQQQIQGNYHQSSRKLQKTPKKKKPIYKKWWFWTIIAVIILLSVSGSGGDDNENANPALQTAVEETDNPSSPENILCSELTDIANNYSGEFKSTNIEDGRRHIEISLPNNESEIEEALTEIIESLKNNNVIEPCSIVVQDADGILDANMLIIDVAEDKTYQYVYQHPKFKTAHYQWIESQFSAWDGSHTELESLIKSSLNDEKSYEHIETTYIDVETEEVMNQINEAIATDGYDDTVEIGDLFITVKFSAKNGFNATIKNVAFGISSYSNNTITLIAID